MVDRISSNGFEENCLLPCVAACGEAFLLPAFAAHRRHSRASSRGEQPSGTAATHGLLAASKPQNAEPCPAMPTWQLLVPSASPIRRATDSSRDCPSPPCRENDDGCSLSASHSPEKCRLVASLASTYPSTSSNSLQDQQQCAGGVRATNKMGQQQGAAQSFRDTALPFKGHHPVENTPQPFLINKEHKYDHDVLIYEPSMKSE